MKHITINCGKFDDIEVILVRLRQAIRKHCILADYREKMFFTKPSEHKRQERKKQIERVKRRYKGKQFIKSDQPLIRFSKQERYEKV